jgi:hypothetical protein
MFDREYGESGVADQWQHGNWAVIGAPERVRT